jgi:hypothetical protein
MVTHQTQEQDMFEAAKKDFFSAHDRTEQPSKRDRYRAMSLHELFADRSHRDVSFDRNLAEVGGR